MMSMNPVFNSNEVPQNMTDKESAEYWDKHELTEDFLLQARPLDDDEMPPKISDFVEAVCY